MNVPTEIAHKVVESLRATPFLLGLVLINTLVLGGFALTLMHVSEAMERREKVMERCLMK